jgi:hypothetical protein
MNHALWKATGARVLALTFIIAGAAACDRGDDDRDARTSTGSNSATYGLPSDASPSAQVIGTPPAPPSTTTANTAQTVPVAPEGRSDVSKASENGARPLEGDNHSHSTLAPTTPQKANGTNTTGDGEGGKR